MANPRKTHRRKEARQYPGSPDWLGLPAREIKHLHLPSGLQRGIPFLIPDNWSAQEALAAFEMLDDLREVIWRHYHEQIQELLKEQRGSAGQGADCSVDDFDEPF